MRASTLPDTSPKTDEEYMREIDRMATEIRTMLDNSRRSIDDAHQIGKETDRILDRLEQRYLCGKK